MRRQGRLVDAAGDARGQDAELLAEASELVGELGFGVRMGHGVGETGVEDGKVTREGEALGGAVEEASEEADLVGLSPYAVELERRRSGGEAEAEAIGGDGIVVVGGGGGGEGWR